VCVGQDVDKDQLQFVHWVVCNINGKAQGDKIESGKTFVDYFPPTPLLNGGLHRYVYLLCSQNEKDIVIKEKYDDDKSRESFNLREFIVKYGLKEKGICFFHSKWHPSVPGPHLRLDYSILDQLSNSKNSNNKKKQNNKEKSQLANE